MRSFILAAAFATCVCATSLAAAQERSLGDDEVTLKNGGSVRGTVISLEPGSKVIILEYGQEQPRTLVWAEVADVQKGKFAAAATEKPTATEDAGAAGPGYGPIKKRRTVDDDSEEGAEGSEGSANVKVHIDSPEPVELYQQVGSAVVRTGRYVAVVGVGRRVCSSPCDKEVDAGGRYAIVGDGMPNSRVFKLPNEGEAHVKVSPGSTGLVIGGIALVSIGGAGIVGGVSALVVGALGDADAEAAYIGGGVALGVGLAAVGGSIAMLVLGRTTIEVTSGAPPKDTAAEQQTFEIDRRPAALAPRYWLGEF